VATHIWDSRGDGGIALHLRPAHYSVTLVVPTLASGA